jgi:ribonuclease Z
MATELRLASGLRVAYSGDCRPAPAFAEACRDTHLLIHEATFGNDLAEHALQKGHCTIGEALGIARDMRARRVLLTHFSQRYTKADSPRLNMAQSTDGLDQCVLMGFDFMSVKLGDFKKAECFLPAIGEVMEGLADPSANTGE